MGNDKKKDSAASGIILLAKRSGKTSFASLSSIKKALNTGKVGHTGTLDSFADGLLVVLSGRLTRLVPHITGFDKKYLALIEFGSETDTLDPTGNIIKTGPVPSEEAVKAALPEFCGQIMQVPPLFSALHVNGKRASELAREGKTAELKARPITIYSIELKEFMDRYALVEVHCSKGTYIRSLARDIAEKCGSCAHLKALRRTSVGPFKLEDAAGFEQLQDFSMKPLLENVSSEGETSDPAEEEKLKAEIKASVKEMTPEVAEFCGMEPVKLSPYFVDDFSNGRPLRTQSFFWRKDVPVSASLAVFYPHGGFAGVVDKNEKKFSYGFVIPVARRIPVYTWEQVVTEKIPEELCKNGTALTIGSFDGPHLGHDELFDAVLSKKNVGLAPGIITFRRSTRSLKNPAEYPGDISTLSQRLEAFAEKGFAFAVVIDFSPEFCKIEGLDFLKILTENCRMKFLAEGKDFRCGYKGSCDMTFIEEKSNELGFSLGYVDSVMFEGERIGASRIRDCIGSAAFDKVNSMMDNPFIMDCSDFEWTEESAEGLRIFTSRTGNIQIKPPDGTYRVCAAVRLDSQKSGGTQGVRAYRSDCMLENGTIRLSFSDKLISGFVFALQFGNPDENKL